MILKVGVLLSAFFIFPALYQYKKLILLHSEVSFLFSLDFILFFGSPWINLDSSGMYF